jgi:serine/threonine protein kinase
VAIKVLHKKFAKFEEAVHRFLREARAASSIAHPNIVDVTDFGPMPDGGVYFVMEYLDGSSLEDIIEREGALELHRGLNIANQIALALAAAHEMRIVHRDLKPDNIMLIKKPGRRDVIRALSKQPTADETPTGKFVVEREGAYDFVKVLDFGIAKVVTPDELTTHQTIQGAVFGTPEYMSPEAARGEEVDLRSDIYSLGVITYDMLTGHPPFEATAAAEVLAMHINQEPLAPSEAAPQQEITRTADAVILKCIAKHREQRYQSMDEFRTDLQHCYGSVAFKRNATSIPGAPSIGKEARAKRLTEELDEWLHSDQPSLSEREARIIAMIGGTDDSFRPADHDKIAAALDDDE